jgi:hypothetical protein
MPLLYGRLTSVAINKDKKRYKKGAPIEFDYAQSARLDYCFSV